MAEGVYGEPTSTETRSEIYLGDIKKELFKECDSIGKELEEYQSKLLLLGIDTLLRSDTKLALLVMKWNALKIDHEEWQKRSPETICASPDVLLELGKEQLQKVKNDLENLLSAVCSQNEQLDEDLEREQQWCEEQEQILNSLNRIEEERKHQVEQRYKTRELEVLRDKKWKLKTYRKELSRALAKFLEEHFPLPQDSGSTIKKNFPPEPAVELLSMKKILEILINRLIDLPFDPYVTVNESFWPPYIELLLRFGMALRHPEDPNRIRLQAFHE